MRFTATPRSPANDAWPVQISTVASHLRLTIDQLADQHALMGDLWRTAMETVETETGRALYPQTCQAWWDLDELRTRTLCLPRGAGNVSVSGVTIRDEAGTYRALANTKWRLSGHRISPADTLHATWSGLIRQEQPNAAPEEVLRVTWTAGYTSPDHVPYELRNWVSRRAATLFVQAADLSNEPLSRTHTERRYRAKWRLPRD